MYWWNIEKLKKSLGKGALPQNFAFKYLIYFIFLRLGQDLFFQSGANSSWNPENYRWVGVPLALISDILEIYATYKLNGGRSGRDYLGRYFSIKLLTNLRYFVFGILLTALFFLIFAWEFVESEDILVNLFAEKPFLEILFVYSSLVFYKLIIPLRIVFHIKQLNTDKVNQEISEN